MRWKYVTKKTLKFLYHLSYSNIWKVQLENLMPGINTINLLATTKCYECCLRVLRLQDCRMMSPTLSKTSLHLKGLFICKPSGTSLLMDETRAFSLTAWTISDAVEVSASPLPLGITAVRTWIWMGRAEGNNHCAIWFYPALAFAGNEQSN